ncbi:hypothetical protein LCGC14_1845520 [marine sediment metagenome]|uniref:Uncharacterized protein n=1 Tax=marine sediment metagenome TaxID=412755 RepID=A0A0F9H086_9ZZZZ
MTEVLLKKELGGLRPASDDAYRVLGNLKNGVELVCDVRDPSRRSNAQHAFWFALANTLFESQDYYKTFDHFRACLLIHMGYCEIYQMKGRRGEQENAVIKVPIAKSLKFGKMPQDEFNSLVEDTLAFAEAMGFDRDSLLAMTRERAA